MKTGYRYQRLSLTGHILAHGKSVTSVESLGSSYIVYYKRLRWTLTGYYPQWKYLWHDGLNSLADTIRKAPRRPTVHIGPDYIENAVPPN